MISDPVFLVVATVAVAILGLSKGGFAGIGMISTPMVAAVSDPIIAAGLMLPVMMVQDPVAMFMYRKSFDARLLRQMLPAAAVGVGAAYVFAASVPVWGVQIGLGAISLVFALWQLAVIRRGLPHIAPEGWADRVMAAAAGLGSGFTSAIAHAGSPPFQMYVMSRRLPNAVYVGTSVMFFAATNAMKLPSYAALGLFRKDLLILSALFIPLSLVTSWLGARLVRRIDVRQFALAITLILLAVAVALIFQGISAIS